MRRLALSITILLFSSLILLACSPTQFVNAFNDSDLEIKRNIPYGPLERQVLDVYTSPDKASRGVLVFIHGGYWDSGDKSEYAFVGDAFATQGYTTVLINYRLVPAISFPAYVEDAALALKWITTSLTDVSPSANVDKLMVMGHSAGAHIGALASFDERYLGALGLSPDTIDAFIGLAGPYDFLPLAPDDERSRRALGDEANYTQTQPINFVDGTEPATYLATGLADTTVQPGNSLRFAERIEEEGGDVLLVTYPELDHSFLIGAVARIGRVLEPSVLSDILAFMESVEN